MHHPALIVILALLIAGSATQAQSGAGRDQARVTLSFDKDWRFLKDNADGAEKPGFDDARWRQLDVPHDWSIEGPYDQQAPSGRGGGYLPSGISWYRRHFVLGDVTPKHRVFVEFDGVMANSDIWINGYHLGHRPYGYISFRYELTGHLNLDPQASNVLAVRTDTTVQPTSRWYTGQGIYRHVRLVVTDPIHIEPWGVFVTTPQVATTASTVRVQTSVINDGNADSEITLQTTIIGPDGQAVQSTETTRSLATGAKTNFNQILVVTNSKLWNLDDPALYQVVSQVRRDGELLDDTTTTFGIRRFKWEPDTGFRLNGKNIKIKGVCLHHDAGGLGAAVPLSAWQRRLERLRQTGANAIRTSHNPPSPELLDLADRMGFLVMDETFDTWTSAKNHAERGYNLHFAKWWEADARDMILRDRNHPSVVIYSAGNEIHDGFNRALGWELFLAQRDLIHRLDHTRPVTLAVFRPNQDGVYDNGFAELTDIIGQNYRENELVRAYQDKPERKVIGTENTHDHRVWLTLRDNPFMSGQFLWTGIDYLGESDWPAVIHPSGLLDSTGAFRPRGYQRQSWWSDEPMVHVVRIESNRGGNRQSSQTERYVSDWTPRDPQTYTTASLEVYSNCEDVELTLNGKSLGSQPRPANDAPRTWRTPYEPGVLRAVGRNAGQIVATHELRTAGPAAAVLLTAEATELACQWDDVCYVTATVVDAQGVPCPWADNLITFAVDGPGTIAAVENGHIASHEPFQGAQRRAHRGVCYAILRSTAPSGKITISASADGLTMSSITLQAVAAR